MAKKGKRQRGRDKKPRKLPPHAFQKNNQSGVDYRFKPGESGNVGGRPKNTPLTDALRNLIDVPIGDKPMLNTMAEKLAWDMITGKASQQHFSEIANRIEGRPRQPVEHSGPGGTPISVEVTAKSLAELAAEILKERSKDAT